MTSTIFPDAAFSSGQSFSFAHRSYSFRLEGNFSTANWTLYKHDIVKNSSWILIHPTEYDQPVILPLDVGFYSLIIEVNATAPINLITKAYGIPHRNITLMIYSTVLSLGIIGIHFLWNYVPQIRKRLSFL